MTEQEKPDGWILISYGRPKLYGTRSEAEDARVSTEDPNTIRPFKYIEDPEEQRYKEFIKLIYKSPNVSPISREIYEKCKKFFNAD